MTARHVPAARTAPRAADPPLARVLRDVDTLRYAILRGDPSHGRGELDVLVHPRDLARFRRTLDHHGFARLPSWGHHPHRFHAAYDDNSDGWVKLDLVTRLAFGPGRTLVLGGAAQVLQHRVRRASAFVPRDGDAFWLLLFHVLLDGSTSDHRQRLRDLLPAGSSPPAWCAGVLGPVVATQLCGWVAEGCWERLAPEGERLLDALGRVQRSQVRLRAARNRAGRLVGRFLDPARRPTVVAVRHGTEQQAGALAARLQGGFPIPVEVVHGPVRWRDRRAVVAVTVGDTVADVHVEASAGPATGLRLDDPPQRLRAAVWAALPAARPGEGPA